MAKYHDMGIADISLVAAVDMTAKQYFFVKAGSVWPEVSVATGASDPGPLGILQNSPSAGQEARIRVLGFSKLLSEAANAAAACQIKYGQLIVCGSDGRGAPTGSGLQSNANAKWMSASFASGCIYGEVLLLAAGVSVCSAS